MINGGVIGKSPFVGNLTRSGVWSLQRVRLDTLAERWPRKFVGGYVAGGQNQSLTYSSNITAFRFLDDSSLFISAGLSAPSVIGAASASTTHGYIASAYGLLNIVADTVDKFNIDLHVSSLLEIGLSTDNSELTSFASSTSSYFAGGFVDSTSLYVDTVDKFAFSNDVRSTLGTGLSNELGEPAGFASSTAGYVAGGYAAQIPARTDVVDKFAFSNDVRTTLGIGLSTARQSLAGFASPLAGYAAGGRPGGAFASTVDKFAFTDDSRTTLGTGLSIARAYLAGFASPLAGYVAGGHFIDNNDYAVTTVDKFDFNNDARSTLSAGLTSPNTWASGFAPQL
jgi:hypothetical protein